MRWHASLYVSLFALALFPLVVFAQIPDPGTNTEGFVNLLVDAVGKGQWRVVSILAAIGVVYALRQIATRLPGNVGLFFRSSRGGALTALLGGVVTTLAGLLIGGGPLNIGVLVNGVVLGVSAAGGWTLLRRLVWGDKPPTFYPASSPASSATTTSPGT